MNDGGRKGRRTPAEKALAGLKRLHDEVEERCAGLAARHAGRLRCGPGCSSCCIDGLRVFAVEAERIRRSHPELLRAGRAYPPGACPFLDQEDACRIYDVRPYVCRTQGLPLRWFETGEDGSGFEMRDICPLNESPATPVELLREEDCWAIGPLEQRLAGLQSDFGRGSMARIALRSLFERDDD